MTGAAYTNNDADPNTATALFDFDSVLDQVAVQSPPNNGSLVATGKFGVDSGPEIGADIYSVVRQGTTVENHAFASVRSGSTSWFTEVDLLTGRVTSRDRFSAGDTVIGLTVPLSGSARATRATRHASPGACMPPGRARGSPPHCPDSRLPTSPLGMPEACPRSAAWYTMGTEAGGPRTEDNP